jgi:cytochrome P450
MSSTILTPDARGAETRRRYQELYADTTKSLDELVRIEDPAFYVNPWPVYERLQAEAPVYFYDRFNTWVLTKHEDVKTASRQSEIFSAQHGILLYDAIKRDAGISTLFAGDGDIIGLTDPPRHGELRRIMQPPFLPESLKRLETHIGGFCDQLLDRITADVPVDWVEAVTSRLPVMVVAAILGIGTDESVLDKVRAWTDATEDLVSRDLSPEELSATLGTFDSLNVFIEEMIEEKRRHPGDDFLSSLLSDHLDNERLSASNLLGFVQLLIAAGADTTRAMLSELIAHLAIFDDQRRLLVADRTLVPNAIEEALRYAPSARGFARQVVQDTTLRGQQLKAGQRVWMAYDAANRDPDAFERPAQFDITRQSNRRNVAFGFGTHVCIAAPLVRLEARILLEKLIDRFPDFEIAGGGHRVESFLRNGWHDLPVVFHPPVNCAGQKARVKDDQRDG